MKTTRKERDRLRAECVPDEPHSLLSLLLDDADELDRLREGLLAWERRFRIGGARAPEWEEILALLEPTP